MQKIRKAILPVAGLGTRVLPATKAIPKEMLPVADRPAIQYVVDEALEAGIEHIVFVTGRNKSAIEDYFDRAYELEHALQLKQRTDTLTALEAGLLPPGASSFVRQQAPLGLGHAIWCAHDIIGDEPFAVLLPDVLVKAAPSCLAQMVEAYNQTGSNIIAVDPISAEKVLSYGVIDPVNPDKLDANKLIEMKGMIEKPSPDQAPSNLKITGRYILQPEIFALLADQDEGAGNEIQLTDAMARLMDKQPFHAFKYDGKDYDCGSKIGYFEAILAYALDHEEIGEEARTLVMEAATHV